MKNLILESVAVVSILGLVVGCKSEVDATSIGGIKLGLSEAEVAELRGAPLFLIPTTIEVNPGEGIGDPIKDIFFTSRRFFERLEDRERVTYFGFNAKKELVMISITDETLGGYSEEEKRRIEEMEMDRYRRQE